MAFEEELGLTEDELEPAQQRLGITAIIQVVFSIFGRRIGAFLSLILMYVIYGIVQGIVMGFVVGPDDVVLAALLTLDPLSYVLNVNELLQIVADPSLLALPIIIGAVLMIGGFLVYVLVIGAGVKFALETYAGQAANVGQCFSAALERFVPLLVVQLIISTITTVVVRPLGYLGLFMFLTEDLDYLTSLSGVTLLLMISLLFVYMLFLISMVVVMDEEEGPFKSMWKSITATSRNLGFTISAILLFLIVAFVVEIIIEVAAILLLGGYGYLLASFIFQIIYLPLLFTFQAVFYRNVGAESATSQSQELW